MRCGGGALCLFEGALWGVVYRSGVLFIALACLCLSHGRVFQCVLSFWRARACAVVLCVGGRTGLPGLSFAALSLLQDGSMALWRHC